MKNYIYKIIFIGLLLQVSSMQYADLSGRAYNQKIIAIENMLDGSIPMDIEFMESNLKLLRDRTTSSDRVQRINNAYRRFNAFMDAQARKRSAEIVQPIIANPAPAPQPKPQKTVGFRDQPNIISIPASVRKGMSARQRLKTLLLYTKSLASTADVAIIVKQKDNAQASLVQAARAIVDMQEILIRHPKLVETFAPRVQALHNRIAKTLEEVSLMQ